MAKHEVKAGPRICQGCGEWFDAKGAEKVCPNDACADLASKIMKEAKEHEAEIKRYYPPGQHVASGDQNRVYDHQNWRDNHRPALGAPRARAREENLRPGWRFGEIEQRAAAAMMAPAQAAHFLDIEGPAIEWRQGAVQGEVDNLRAQRAAPQVPMPRFQAALDNLLRAQQEEARVIAAQRRRAGPPPEDDGDFDP